MPLEESHTGEYMAGKYLEMLAEWEIKHDWVHLVLRDNAANLAKAKRDASLTSLGCFAYTLQLVVHNGVLSQRVVRSAVKAGSVFFWAKVVPVPTRASAFI